MGGHDSILHPCSGGRRLMPPFPNSIHLKSLKDFSSFQKTKMDAFSAPVFSPPAEAKKQNKTNRWCGATGEWWLWCTLSWNSSLHWAQKFSDWTNKYIYWGYWEPGLLLSEKGSPHREGYNEPEALELEVLVWALHTQTDMTSLQMNAHVYVTHTHINIYYACTYAYS